MYKVILLDYSMPDLDGPSVAKGIAELLEENPTLKKPLICCCTAYSEASFKRTALDSGMDQFLTKPVTFMELRSVLSSHL